MPDKSLASFRGVGYWPGDRNNPPRIIFTTGSKMMALNARSGKVDPGFGKEGSVDLEVAVRRRAHHLQEPLVCRHELLRAGRSAHQSGAGSGQRPDSRTARLRCPHRQGAVDIPYHSRTTASPATKPGPRTRGRIAPGTMSGLSRSPWMKSAAFSTFRSADRARTIYGGDRPGKNLFGNALVALDANTGKMKWYFQTVHHELWDYNLPPAPGLIDIKKDGKIIPALAQVGKSGYMFILNRVTGEPVYGVEERPVAKSDVPGEVSYPDAAVSVKAARDFAHQHDAETISSPPRIPRPTMPRPARNSGSDAGLFNSGSVHYVSVSRGGRRNAKPAIIFPGFTGGANWGGTATDPKLGYIFVNTKDAPAVGWMQANPKYVAGNKDGIEPFIRSAAQRPREFQRARARCGRKTDRQLSVLQTAMGPLDRGQRRDRRFRLGSSLGRHRLAAGGQAKDRRNEHAPDRSSPRAGWCSSARPRTIASARSIRGPARSCG